MVSREALVSRHVMQNLSFESQQPNFFPIFDHPLFSHESSSFLNQDIRSGKGRPVNGTEGSLDPAFLHYSVKDYRVGRADTLHATMVYEFLRLYCQEEPSQQAADAVVIVDIQGYIHGYGCRHDSSFIGVFERWYGCRITEMLSENLKRRWLNQNIECLALQRRHWRVFRLYDMGTTPMVLMEFHPVEIQRTALVLWGLEP